MTLIDLDNLQLYDKEIKAYLKQKLLESIDQIVVSKDTYLQFPTVGNEKTLYIGTTENKTYRWDSEQLKYYVVGSDWHDIKIIDGNWE